MAFKAAKCPNCAGELQVPEGKKAVKCMYCGSDIIVQEAIKAAGVNIANLLNLARNAAVSGNNQEAYDYYTKILEINVQSYEAWFGKGEAAGWMSALGLEWAFRLAAEPRRLAYRYLVEPLALLPDVVRDVIARRGHPGGP